MHPHLEDVFALLDDSRAALRAAVARVPPGMRRRRPAPDRWSVNDVLEHLSLVEARWAAAVSEAIAQARAAGLGPERDPREPLDDALRQRLISRAERREAPPPSRPTGTLDDAAAWAALERAHEAFRAALREADGLALGSVRATHSRWGALTVYQFAEVIAGHARRHAEQIAELATETT
jgi:hypothetical protein